MWPPSALAKALGNLSGHPGVAFEHELGAGLSLGAYAAKEGFKMVTKAFLYRLARSEKLQFARGEQPKTVEDIVKVLILHFVPAASEPVESSASCRSNVCWRWARTWTPS